VVVSYKTYVYMFPKEILFQNIKKRFKEEKQEQLRREKGIVFGALLNTDIFSLQNYRLKSFAAQ